MDYFLFITIGLILGAILPPLFFGRDWVSVVVLNLCGFPFFLFPSFVLLMWMGWGDLPEEMKPTREDYYKTFAACAMLFFTLEALLFILRWLVLLLLHLVHSIARLFRKPNTTPPPSPPYTRKQRALGVCFHPQNQARFVASPPPRWRLTLRSHLAVRLIDLRVFRRRPITGNGH